MLPTCPGVHVTRTFLLALIGLTLLVTACLLSMTNQNTNRFMSYIVNSSLTSPAWDPVYTTPLYHQYILSNSRKTDEPKSSKRPELSLNISSPEIHHADLENTRRRLPTRPAPANQLSQSPFIIPDNISDSSYMDQKAQLPAIKNCPAPNAKSNRSNTSTTDGSIDTGRIKTFSVIYICHDAYKRSFRCNVRERLDICSHKCQQTEKWEEADAVVFNMFRIIREDLIPEFHRTPGQLWVMMTMEAAIRVNFVNLNFPRVKGQFNWTMTYRLDSDIPLIYGKLRKVQAPNINYDTIYQQKNVTAAWFVSHCKTSSGRAEYVREMQRFTDVHVFGTCGNYTCGTAVSRWKSDPEECFPMLSKSYFFYLAFENSLCVDYVTEKFFKMFNNVDIVPVVRGRTDYKRYFPSDTFVDASDFKSPKDLATYLVQLSKDKNRYLALLKAKNTYRNGPTEHWLCQLCRKLHTDNCHKSYPDLRAWFLNDTCEIPSHI